MEFSLTANDLDKAATSFFSRTGFIEPKHLKYKNDGPK